MFTYQKLIPFSNELKKRYAEYKCVTVGIAKFELLRELIRIQRK